MNNSVNLLALVMQASIVVQVIMAVLLLLSLLSWAIIFHASGKLSSQARFDARFSDWLWSKDDLHQQFETVKQETERRGLEAVFFVGFEQLQKTQTQQAQVVERALRTELGVQQMELEKGFSMLASIGSISPYIGLFGTVWGIMHAFIGLGQSDTVSLATVAPSIAEALIATALGLFAAIPASFAFNFFTAKANQIYENRALFCEKVVTHLMAASAQTSQTQR